VIFNAINNYRYYKIEIIANQQLLEHYQNIYTHYERMYQNRITIRNLHGLSRMVFLLLTDFMDRFMKSKYTYVHSFNVLEENRWYDNG